MRLWSNNLAQAFDLERMPSRPPRTFLYSGPFQDNWAESCLAMLEKHSASCGEAPLILLPTDIQLDDYAPFFRVAHGHAADRALRLLLEGGSSHTGRLIFIDLAPEARPCDGLLIPALLENLASLPEDLTLVVAVPDPTPLPATLFDLHLPLLTQPEAA